MSDVERLADRIVMLHEGRVLIDSELDELREHYSLALVPHSGGTSRITLLSLEGCLGARERSDALHAVFNLEPESTSRLLETELGITDLLCSRIALEDMFVELAGGQQ